MHECHSCGQMCDCDGEDLHQPQPDDCACDCDDGDDFEDDGADDDEAECSACGRVYAEPSPGRGCVRCEGPSAVEKLREDRDELQARCNAALTELQVLTTRALTAAYCVRRALERSADVDQRRELETAMKFLGVEPVESTSSSAEGVRGG